MSLGQKSPSPDTPDPPYGSHQDNPVLCGGGVEAEFDYLERLRCPNGRPVRFKRIGSVPRTQTSYLKRSDVKLHSARSVNPAEPEFLPLDAYAIECDCEQHVGEVFVDMYFRGRELPLGFDGWTLVPGVSPAEKIAPNSNDSWSCPYCGQQLRTSQAKQCRYCKMDWHDPTNVYCRE